MGDKPLQIGVLEAALRIDPFDANNYAVCALACFYLGEYEDMAVYVYEGLLVSPEHEGLNAMYQLLKEREEW